MASSTLPLVAVSGSNGQLGQELQLLAPQFPGLRFLFLTRENFPLDDEDAIRTFLATHPVNFFINGAAYTAVDKAESDQENAMRINGSTPGVIAEMLALTGGKMIQISTDYVFDGNSSVPLTEEVTTDPVNVYGKTKRAGEVNALRQNPQTMIVRTSWLYSVYGNNFVKTMLRLMSSRDAISVVSDQRGSPTNARDLAKALLDVIVSPVFIPGVYHYSNEGEASWYEFALEIKRLSGSTCLVNPVDTTGYPTPAKRPAWSLMDKTKIRNNYQLTIPEWKRSLETCMKELMK